MRIFRFLIDCKTELDKKKIISTAVMIVAVGMTLFTVLGIPIMEGLHYSYTVYAIIYILLNVICGMLSALLRGIGKENWKKRTVAVIVCVLIFVVFYVQNTISIVLGCIVSIMYALIANYKIIGLIFQKLVKRN